MNSTQKYTDKQDQLREIASLISKAANAEKSEDAVRFSQAACNAANAEYLLRQME